MKLLDWELPRVCSVTHQSLVVCAPEQCPPFGSAENISFHVAEMQAELWGVCLWDMWASEYRGDLAGADWSLVFVSIVVAEVLTFSNEGVYSLLQKIIQGSCFSCCFVAQRRDPASAGVKCLLCTSGLVSEWQRGPYSHQISCFILLRGPGGGRC